MAQDSILTQTNSDNVNHPKHYESGKFECIDVPSWLPTPTSSW